MTTQRITIRHAVRHPIWKNRGKFIAFAVLLALSVIWIMPVIWTLFSSFKANIEAKQFIKLRNIIPLQWTLENYVYVFSTPATPLLQWLMNSFIVAGSQCVIVLFICSTSAYAYERLQLKGKETLFWVVFGLSMFPNVVSLVPMFQIMTALRWIDKLPSLIFPGVTAVFNIFLIRNFLKGVPRDLDEAASIDGGGAWRIYFHIILPNLRPVLTVVALFSFTAAWNDFVWPSIAITTPKNMTLTPGLRLLQVSEQKYVVRQLAGGVIGMIPTFIIYLFAQKYFLGGLNLGSGVKG